MNYQDLTREELVAQIARRDELNQTLRTQVQTAAENARLVHELQVHQVELEAQNQALRAAEKDLEASRGRYADLYDFAPIGYLTLDPHGVVLEINLTGATMLGRPRSRIVGKPLLVVVRFADADSLRAHLARCIESDAPVQSELMFVTEQGPMEVNAVSTAVRSATGKAVACRTALSDVSQRRRAEREVVVARSSDQRLRARLEAIDHAGLAVQHALAALSHGSVAEFFQVIVTEARGVVGAEFAALSLGGGEDLAFAPWAFSGLDAAQTAAFGQARRDVGLLGSLARADRPIRVADVREHPGFLALPPGAPTLTSLVGVPVMYDGANRGALILANKVGAEEFTEDDQVALEMLAERIGVALEIARLQQVEVRERAWFQFLAKAGSVLAESLDFDGTLRAVGNVLVPELADLCLLALVQENGELRLATARHTDPARQVTLDLLAESIVARSEIAQRVRESRRPELITLTPEYLDSRFTDATQRALAAELKLQSAIVAPLVVRGAVIGVLWLVMAESGRALTALNLPRTDEIAHRAAHFLDSARLYRTAAAAIQARDDLVAIVAHDLRNHVTGIRWGVTALMKTTPADAPPAGRTQLERMDRAARRMDQLIAGLHDAAMMESGHFTVALARESAATMVEETLSVLAVQTDVAAIVVTTDLPPGLPEVWCDRGRMLQVLENVISNAIKLTPRGGEIHVAAERVDDTVLFSVQDSGPGIPESVWLKIFDRYWRGRHDGTGLGLFIAQGIIAAHQGRIWVESEPTQGSTFFFTLPVARAVG